jgi:hypothetical protein
LTLFDFEEAYRWGIRRFFVWLPHGMTKAPEPFYPLDALLEAQTAGLKWLANGFVEAWSNWLDAHTDAQVMFYLGHPFTTTTIGKKSGSDWFHRALLSVAPIMALAEAFQGRISLSVDSCMEFDADSEIWQFAQHVRQRMEFSCETLPSLDKPHWNGPAVVTQEFFDGRTATRSIPDAQLIGPVRVTITKEIPLDALKAKVTETLSDGRAVDWVIAGLPALWQAGRKFSELGALA